MEKFQTLTALAAPLDMTNVDTDMIIPKQFLKTILRSGLGKNLFDELRYDEKGNEIEDFILNKEPFRDAEILIGGENFGCGSSREHAVWALKGFGIRVVIAPSFADIFHNNCFKNGVLPVILPEEQVKVLMEDAEKGHNARLTVNLETQTVTSPSGTYSFDIAPFQKECLIKGLDDIALTMAKKATIRHYEAVRETQFPWLLPAS